MYVGLFLTTRRFATHFLPVGLRDSPKPPWHSVRLERGGDRAEYGHTNSRRRPEVERARAPLESQAGPSRALTAPDVLAF
jgi:hypothetical protein